MLRSNVDLSFLGIILIFKCEYEKVRATMILEADRLYFLLCSLRFRESIIGLNLDVDISDEDLGRVIGYFVGIMFLYVLRSEVVVTMNLNIIYAIVLFPKLSRFGQRLKLHLRHSPTIQSFPDRVGFICGEIHNRFKGVAILLAFTVLVSSITNTVTNTRDVSIKLHSLLHNRVSIVTYFERKSK
jgi:hypothetical protein